MCVRAPPWLLPAVPRGVGTRVAWCLCTWCPPCCRGLYLAALTAPVVEIGEVSLPQLRSIAAEARLVLSSLLWWRGRGTSPDNIPLNHGLIDGLSQALAATAQVDSLSPEGITRLGEAIGVLCDAASAVPVRAFHFSPPWVPFM